MSEFKRYPAYKDSGVEWLGELPKHWESKRLKFLFLLRKRTVREQDQIVTCFRDGVVTLRANRRTEGFTNALKEIGYQGVRAGDLVISAMDAFAGAIGVSDSHGKSSPVYSVCAPVSNEISAYYYARLLRHMALAGFVTSLAKGVRERSTDFRWSDAAEIFLPVPPVHEQTQIARFLDHETARIDALIEEQQRLIELLKEKRQAVISQAVTKGLDPTVPMKDSGVEWLGEVPAHWTIKRLKQLVLDASGIQMGPFGGMLVDLDDSDTGYKVYGQENTISGDFSSGGRWIPEHRYFALSNYHLEVGDIVMTRKGSLGNCRRVSLLPQAGIIDSDTIRVRVQGQMMNPHYLELLLHEAGYISTQLSLVKRGAILSGLNSEIIANLVIVVPPRDGQEELLLEIKAASSKFDQGISDCEYAVGLLRERRSALISAAVTGKIDVRSWQPPANPPSHELVQEAV